MNDTVSVSVALGRRLKMLAMLFPAAALFVACRDDVSGPYEVPRPSFHVVVSPSSLIDFGECVDLLADEGTVVGEVCVINDVENLQVQFRAGGDHRFTETEVEVTLLSLDDDDEDGRFREGQEFERETEHEPPVAKFTHSISSEQLAVVPGNPVRIEAEVDLAELDEEAESDEELDDASAEFTYAVADGALVARFVGPEGGVVQGAAGSPIAAARLDIPAGAFNDPVVIALSEGDSDEFRAASEDLFGSPLPISGPVLVVSTTPSHAEPLQPVVLTLPFDRAAFPSDESVFRSVLLSLSTDGTLEARSGTLDEHAESPSYDFNLVDQTLTALISQFSGFTVASVSANWADQYETFPPGPFISFSDWGIACTPARLYLGPDDPDPPLLPRTIGEKISSGLRGGNGSLELIAEVVWHSTEGEPEQTFSDVVVYGIGKMTGYHYYVARDGTIHQAADLKWRVNHSARPVDINTSSVGISFIHKNNPTGPNPIGHLTQAQLKAAASLSSYLNERFSLSPPTFTGLGSHSFHGDNQTIVSCGQDPSCAPRSDPVGLTPGAFVLSVLQHDPCLGKTLRVSAQGELDHPAGITLDVDEEATLFGLVGTGGAGFDPDVAVTWLSANDDVAKFMEDGAVGGGDPLVGSRAVLKAVSSGTAVIRASIVTPARTLTTDVNITVTGGLPTDAVAFYPFNGNALDESGNGNNGTIRSGVTPTADRFGNANSAFTFTGGLGIEVGDIGSNLDLTGDFTIAFWARKTGPGSPWILHKHRSNVNFDGSWMLLIDQATGLVFHASPFSAPTQYSGPQLPVSPTVGWSFVTLRYRDSDRVWMYDVIPFAGGAPATASGTALPGVSIRDTGHPLLIGIRDDNLFPFPGDLDDIRIFKRVLSNDEILALFGEGS